MLKIIIIVIFFKKPFLLSRLGITCQLPSLPDAKLYVLCLLVSLTLVFPTVSPENLCYFLQVLSLHL